MNAKFEKAFKDLVKRDQERKKRAYDDWYFLYDDGDSWEEFFDDVVKHDNEGWEKVYEDEASHDLKRSEKAIEAEEVDDPGWEKVYEDEAIEDQKVWGKAYEDQLIKGLEDGNAFANQIIESNKSADIPKETTLDCADKENKKIFKSYKCFICAKLFRQKVHLRRHVICHTEKRSFSCLVCTKIVRQGDFLSHIAVHADDPLYTCQICGKEYVRKCNLINHINAHTGPNIFKCAICGANKSVLIEGTKNHSNTVTQAKPFETSHKDWFCNRATPLKTTHKCSMFIRASKLMKGQPALLRTDKCSNFEHEFESEVDDDQNAENIPPGISESLVMADSFIFENLSTSNWKLHPSDTPYSIKIKVEEDF